MVILYSFFFNMNKNNSSSPSGVFVSSSSFDGSIRVSVPIVPLREAIENEGGLLSDTPFAFLKCDVNRLHNTYHILQESFWIFTPSPCIRTNDLLPTEDTIILFKK